jgi:hypothetical protein
MAISISIVAGRDQSTSSVMASGSEQHIITDEERTTFDIGDKELKDSVGAYFGKNPNDAFLHSPTPWDDLYKRYSWPEVQTVLVVQSAVITGITSEPVIVKTQEFKNTSPKKGTFNVSISESVNNTTSSSLNNVKKITVGQKFKYDVKFLGSGGGGETSLSYEQSWGTGGSESLSYTVGSTSGVSVELLPGEGVVAELSASRGKMQIRITYRAYLIGCTAVNYNPTFKDHHFWCLDICSVMSSKGKPYSLEITEDIEIGYYSNSKIELKSLATGNLMVARLMADVAAV